MQNKLTNFPIMKDKTFGTPSYGVLIICHSSWESIGKEDEQSQVKLYLINKTCAWQTDGKSVYC